MFCQGASDQRETERPQRIFLRSWAPSWAVRAPSWAAKGALERQVGPFARQVGPFACQVGLQDRFLTSKVGSNSPSSDHQDRQNPSKVLYCRQFSRFGQFRSPCAYGSLLDASWAPTWTNLASTWPLWWSTWSQLGRSWDQLGRSWGQLGTLPARFSDFQRSTWGSRSNHSTI